MPALASNPQTVVWTIRTEMSNAIDDIAWAVPSLLQFGSGTSPMKEAAAAPPVDRGQAPGGGQAVGAFRGDVGEF